MARAELHLNLAGLLHEQAGERPDLLNAAIPHYHSALQLVLREEAPLLWASAHANLATAYLTMPMIEASGQLRLGVAAQSLRSALKVYTREEHPEQWASVQLNLANSLVYTPSNHQADNLVEAVELYEAVLEARDRDTDPLGRARVLANQGNVLAHLGVFDQAKAKLYEARFIFEEFGDHDVGAHRARRARRDRPPTALNRTDDTGAGGAPRCRRSLNDRLTEPTFEELAKRVDDAVRRAGRTGPRGPRGRRGAQGGGRGDPPRRPGDHRAPDACRRGARARRCSNSSTTRWCTCCCRCTRSCAPTR